MGPIGFTFFSFGDDSASPPLRIENRGQKSQPYFFHGMFRDAGEPIRKGYISNWNLEISVIVFLLYKIY